MELAERIRIRTEIAKTCISRVHTLHGTPGSTIRGRTRLVQARDNEAVTFVCGAWAAIAAAHGEEHELTKTVSMMAFHAGIHGYDHVRQMADWKQPADEAT